MLFTTAAALVDLKRFPEEILFNLLLSFLIQHSLSFYRVAYQALGAVVVVVPR